jgi:AcrR family transcriptional regulator
MSPRPYQLGQRQAATEQTRARIIQAARELLIAPDGFAKFSIETVARQADVARMTVYHQFGSRLGLLEALCDSLASSGGMQQLANAFRQPDPLEALTQYILTFGRFWDVDRLVMRRLRALAALDPDFEQLMHTRDEWGRKGLRVIAQRIIEQQQSSRAEAPGEAAATSCPEETDSYSEEQQAPASSEILDEMVDVLFTLNSFATFDTLAGSTHSPQEVAPLVVRLARAALDEMFIDKSALHHANQQNNADA